MNSIDELLNKYMPAKRVFFIPVRNHDGSITDKIFKLVEGSEIYHKIISESGNKIPQYMILSK